MKGFSPVKSNHMTMRSARTHAGWGRQQPGAPAGWGLPLEGAGLLGRLEWAGRVPGQWGGD